MVIACPVADGQDTLYWHLFRPTVLPLPFSETVPFSPSLLASDTTLEDLLFLFLLKAEADLGF